MSLLGREELDELPHVQLAICHAIQMVAQIVFQVEDCFCYALWIWLGLAEEVCDFAVVLSRIQNFVWFRQ